MTNKDQSKYPYDRSEDGTLTTAPQNVDGFNPDWKCRPDCVAHEVMKEWLEHGHAPNSDELAKRILSLISPPTIDVEALKREIAPILWRDWDDLIDKEQNAITAIVDHLANRYKIMEK